MGLISDFTHDADAAEVRAILERILGPAQVAPDSTLQRLAREVEMMVERLVEERDDAKSAAAQAEMGDAW